MPVDDDAGAIRSIPVAAFAHAGALAIATDAGEWMTLARGDRPTPLPATGPISDIVTDASGALTVACWEPRLEQLRDGAWSRVTLGAPATALAATARGLVLADATGGLSLMTGRVPVQELSTPEPIMALAPIDDGLVTLAASGAVEVTAWPGGDTTLTPVHTGAIGRAHAVFPGLRRGTAIVAGARGLAVLERQRLVAIATDFTDRVAGLVRLGERALALAHADDGTAWLVDDTLARPRRVRLDGDVAGAASGPDGTALAWTTAGALYIVGHDGATWKVADGHVVLGAPEPDQRGAVAIHWTAGTGTWVTRRHSAWN